MCVVWGFGNGGSGLKLCNWVGGYSYSYRLNCHQIQFTRWNASGVISTTSCICINALDKLYFHPWTIYSRQQYLRIPLFANPLNQKTYLLHPIALATFWHPTSDLSIFFAICFHFPLSYSAISVFKRSFYRSTSEARIKGQRKITSSGENSSTMALRRP